MSRPVYYEQYNLASGLYTPSVVHPTDNALAMWYAKYLLQDAMSVFRWTVPDNWDLDYTQTITFTWGYVAVLSTARYGVIPQQATLQGVNIYYRPTHALVSNPLLPSLQPLEIGTECALIRLKPDYTGIGDIVSRYAGLMALAHESLAINLQNSKTSRLFFVADKVEAETWKKAMDQLQQGYPATYADRKLLDDNGDYKILDLSLAAKQSYLGDEITDLLRSLKNSFDSEIGIPNANTDKRERLISDEVNANNVETYSRAEMWLDSLQHGCEEVHRLFGLTKDDLWVDWRYQPETVMGGGDLNAGYDFDDNGAV